MIGKVENLTLFTLNGEKIGTLQEVEIDMDNKEDIIDENNKLDFNPFEECSFEVESKIDSFSFYNLFYGIKMTNNYLKMHGGIMRRRKWLK